MIEDKDNLRPQTFDSFVGQQEIINELKVYVSASKQRQEIMDHVIIYGPPGLGKTSLAHCIANEIKGNIREVSGPSIERVGDLASILSTLSEGDVLFIDEIHRLDKSIEEILYSAMEDYQLNLVVGKDQSARQMTISLPPFILIGATTKMGCLSKPLRDRFGINIKLDYYNQTDLAKIIKRSSEIFGLYFDDESCKKIAKCSRGTPRIAINLTKRIRDFMTMDYLFDLNSKACEKYLIKLGLDDLGLSKLDRKYLSMIYSNYGNNPVGIDLLSKNLGENQELIEEMVEPYLIKIGFLNRTSRGRLVTNLAVEHLNFGKK